MNIQSLTTLGALGALLFIGAAPGPSLADDGAKAPAGASEATVSQAELERYLTTYDDLMRGESSQARVTMNIKNSRWERSLTMEMQSKGQEKSLVRIVAPAKDKGQSTLKVEDNLWNYLPKVDRTIKVPAGMMSGSWMGSHFTNDDLVQESRLSEDFTFSLKEAPSEGNGHLFVIALKPKPDAPVVWGEVVMKLREADKLPMEITYFDEKGALIRTMSFHDVKVLGDRSVPTRMRLTPADKDGEYTEMIYETLTFNIDIPDSTFTLQALKK